MQSVPYAMILIAKYSGIRPLFLSMIVLYKLENYKHDAECWFITAEKGTVSFISYRCAQVS